MYFDMLFFKWFVSLEGDNFDFEFNIINVVNEFYWLVSYFKKRFF